MSGKVAAPNAWDDDWETLADKLDLSDKKGGVSEAGEGAKRLTKAERKAQHAEANRQLWQSAEFPQKPIFLQAKPELPLASEFKPTMKVLSRKPPAATTTRVPPAPGQQADDDEDSEAEERRRAAALFAERQAKAQKEREEKQRKYQEVRERIFSTPSPAPLATSGADEAQAQRQAGNATAPASSVSKAGQASGSRNSSRGKGRGGRNSLEISADRSPARGGQHQQGGQHRQLFDPNYTAKPASSYVQRTANGAGSGSGSRPSTPAEMQHIRAPKGPDGSGRGGFGFAARGK